MSETATKWHIHQADGTGWPAQCRGKYWVSDSPHKLTSDYDGRMPVVLYLTRNSETDTCCLEGWFDSRDQAEAAIAQYHERTAD